MTDLIRIHYVDFVMGKMKIKFDIYWYYKIYEKWHEIPKNSDSEADQFIIKYGVKIPD